MFLLSVIPDKLDDRGCKGAPDWIIEIVSPASRRMDYYTKLFKYRTAGVREYWIVDPVKKLVRCMILKMRIRSSIHFRIRSRWESMRS